MLWTLAESTEFLTLWTAAYKAVIAGQSYSINTGGTSRSLTRNNLKEIKDEMMFWKNYVNQLGETDPTRGQRVKFITPME